MKNQILKGTRLRNAGRIALISAITLSACTSKNSDSKVGEAGGEKTGKDKVLNAGADVLQDKAPLNAVSAYLDGFHFYNGNINAQMEAHHYVTQLSADLYQAIIFDGNTRDAKIMGVEYIVTERLFKTLPEEEKKLWHSHVHEVKSGSLIAPGIPQKAEHELMEKLVSTYGKTIHTWHTDQARDLPVGAPMIMMGFTKDGQLHERLVKDRDARFNVNTAEIKEKRKDIPSPKILPGANAWEHGEIRQFVITDQVDSALNKHQMH
ncbi:OBAP family protein [Pedobacter sp. SYP-B3415]|uniref:OBAP family protein n=1 Tax=Pedobacter sp. SYP-B3415 TaxID=2496641 RepID=UPI00101C1982|nr:OBAP family protein [Pedobacter sp. SYP-B3415]